MEAALYGEVANDEQEYEKNRLLIIQRFGVLSFMSVAKIWFFCKNPVKFDVLSFSGQRVFKFNHTRR